MSPIEQLENGDSVLLHLDITVDLETEAGLKDGAERILERIRPDWPAKDIQWKIFTNGLSNKLIGGWYKDKKDTVLTRVYGIGTDAIIDRISEIENMKMLHTIGAGSELYATFKNGIAYEYIHGSTLTQETVKDAAVYPLVARILAKVHCLDIENGEVGLWKRMYKFIQLSLATQEDPRFQARLEKEYFNKKQLMAEYSMLKELLENTSSPNVFCHNDALLENIIQQQDRVVLIDLEYGGPAPAAFDIANHFNEFVGCGGVLDYETSYPGKEFQLDWIRIYLMEFNRISGKSSPTSEEVEELYCLVQQFTLCSSLMWSAWALIQAKNSNIDFDFVDYAVQRLKEYKRRKSILGMS